AGVLGLLIVGAYYGFAWRSVGRDPPTGTIIPLFGPPDGMSAAAVRYVRNMAFDQRCFTAAIVDLGANGYLRLRDDGRNKVLDRVAGTKEIGTSEQRMFSQLFARGSPLVLEQTNHQVLSGATATLQQNLAETYKNRLFHGNGGWSALGVLL